MEKISTKITNLSFTRSMACSDGLMWSATSSRPETAKPVKVQTVTVAGPRSEAGVTEAQAAEPNPQRIERATLDADHDELIITWSAKFHPVSAENISFCNAPAFETTVETLLHRYGEKGGFGVLARLYAYRVADGTTAWRNRYGKNPTVTVDIEGEDDVGAERLTFDAKTIRATDIRDVARGEGLDDNLSHLAERIEAALAGRQSILYVDVRFSIRMIPGQEVYPSQEMVTNAARGEGRILSKYLDTDQGTMHAQKIGNAIRRIDIWHPQFDKVGAIAVEAYGSSRQHAQAFRYGKPSFYECIKSLKKGDESPIIKALNRAESLDTPDAEEDIHYVVAMIARGGVFSEGGKEKPKREPASEGAEGGET